MRKNKKGFTLVEILVAMAIVIILVTMMMGIFNAIGITNKGRDAQRKKDLSRIKIAFEEYFNDKGYFPNGALVTDLTNKLRCNSNVFVPYLNSWPCDPSGEPYKILVGMNKFRVITNLENKEDKDIPSGWYGRTDFILNGWDISDVNYGVSSTNILWYELDEGMNIDCNTNVCLSNEKGVCSHLDYNIGCSDSFCYFFDNTDGGSCTNKCRTNCCGIGCQ